MDAELGSVGLAKACSWEGQLQVQASCWPLSPAAAEQVSPVDHPENRCCCVGVSALACTAARLESVGKACRSS